MKLNREIGEALAREGYEVIETKRWGRHPVVTLRATDGSECSVSLPTKARNGRMMKNFLSQIRRRMECQNQG